MAIRRLLQLWWLACQYRLDSVLLELRPSLRLRVLLFPALFFTVKASNGARIRQFCEHLGPIYIKFGQLLSTRPDLVPKDWAEELSLLQDQVAPFDSVLFKDIVESALAAPVTELFASYDHQPLASASLAQVHRAQLHSGEQVVIKVLRPNIKQQIERDIKLLRWLATWLNRLIKEAARLRLPEVVEDYSYTILMECNFRNEAANAQKLRDNFIDNPIHYVPEVIWPYVRDNVLVMEYIDAIPVSDRAAIEANGIDIAALSKQGTSIFFTQVFEHNFFHADMHPGNIFVSKQYIENPQYIAIDCAVVGSLSDWELFQLASLWLAVFERDYRRASEVMVFSQWVDKSTPVDRLEAVIRCLYEPVHNQPISEISFGGILLDLFDQTRQFGLRLQPSQVLLQKTLLNIEGLGKQLYPQLDLFVIAKPFLRKWLRERFGPSGLLKKLSQRAPMLLSQLEQLIDYYADIEAVKEKSKK